MARDKPIANMPEASVEAAEYVLGVMTLNERDAFQKRLRDDEHLRASVVYWENALLPLADGVAAVTPPAKTWDALQKRLFAGTQEAAPSRWQSLAFWRGLSLASLVGIAVLGGILATTLNRQVSPASQFVADVTGDSKQVRLAVSYDASTGNLAVNRVEGGPPSGRVLELWLIEGSNAPVSLGVLPSDARGLVAIPESLRAKLANAVLAISDEPAGGSPTGQPTGSVLATGKLLTI